MARLCKVFMNKRHREENTTTSLSFVIKKIEPKQGILTRSSKRLNGGRGLLLKAMRIPPESNQNKKSRLW